MEILLLAPNFLPTLFVLVFCLQWIEPFPMGLLGVMLVHAFINVGMVAVLWSRQMESQLGSLTNLAYLEGARRWQVVLALKEPLLKMAGGWGIFVFILCFSSFTVPLVVGGGRGTTIEVLIYEKIRISADLGSALTLSVLQGISVFVLTRLFSASRSSAQASPQGRRLKVYLLPSSISQFVLVPFVIWSVGYFGFEMLKGWEQLLEIPGLVSSVKELLPPTLWLGAAVSGFVALIGLFQISILSSARIHRDVAGLISLSPSLVGFAFSLAMPEFQMTALVLALACLFYPTAFRSGLQQALTGLELQQRVAALLGASDWQILFKVVLPQLVNPLAALASVVGLWAMGDFAISKIIFPQTFSLGMLAETLMSSYRIDAAFAICGLILVLGIVLALFFYGMAYVYRQKFK